jgi:outer membrane protein assembly factor BamB
MSRFFAGVVAYYGRPAVADLVSGGEPELLFDSSYVLGVMTPEPKAVWSHPAGTYQRDGIGDVNGDGRLAVGGAGYDGRFRCFDGATGEIRWHVPLAGSCTSTVTADIDGDGRDEFLVGIDRRVVAVSETAEGNGAIQWECELPAEPTTPAIADTDGDGLAEIIVMGDDGMVYCLDR